MKQLISYGRKRFKTLTRSLQSYGHLQDPEVLHEIRVEVKKIKVLLNLVNASEKKFKGHQQFIPFRTIFRRAGEIRQPEVVYKLLLRYQIGGVKDGQIPKSGKSDKLILAFQRETSGFIETVKSQKKRIGRYVEKISKTDARKYLKKKRREVERLLFPSFRNENLHMARKITKEVIYLCWLDRKLNQDTFYKDIEDIIGVWHDKQVLLPILRKAKAMDEVTRLKESSKIDLRNLKKRVREYYKP